MRSTKTGSERADLAQASEMLALVKPATLGEQLAAARLVCAAARDDDDRVELLAMLGLTDG